MRTKLVGKRWAILACLLSGVVTCAFLPSTATASPAEDPDGIVCEQGTLAPLVCGVTESWVARYDGPDGGDDRGRLVAGSPDGSTIYVAVVTHQAGYDLATRDYGLVAYDTQSGNQRWDARYNGPSNDADVISAVAVSPDGSTVYLTGESAAATSSWPMPVPDYATVAYDADTGAERWVARYNGPVGLTDSARDVVVSPDGSTVFVTGESYGDGTSFDYVTIAYDAATGEQRWMTQYNGPLGRGTDKATALGVSPDGSRVFVTGESRGVGTGLDYATVAYAAATGAELWVTRYNDPGNGNDQAKLLEVSPNGSQLYVVDRWAYSIVAYHTADGGQLWTAAYQGPGDGVDVATAMALSPDGSRVFLTGYSSGVGTGYADIATVAYRASDGSQLWVARHDGPASGSDSARDLVASADSSRVYATGWHQRPSGNPLYANNDYATLGYDATDGSQLWLARYEGPSEGDGNDEAYALHISPDGFRISVTGQSYGDTSWDSATVAYHLEMHPKHALDAP